MAPQAKRRRSNGARRRKALRDVSANERWLHLSDSGINTKYGPACYDVELEDP